MLNLTFEDNFIIILKISRLYVYIELDIIYKNYKKNYIHRK